MIKINLRPFLTTNSDTLELRCASGPMQAAMVKARARQEEAVAEALADNLQKALEAQARYVEMTRTQIRMYKRKVSSLVDDLNQVDRARAYLEETSNPVPWFLAIGMIDRWQASGCGVSSEEFVELSTIPGDWKPAGADE